MSTIKLSKNEQFLYFFGSNHSYNPKDNQFFKLKSFWLDFLEETRNKECLAVIESNLMIVDPSFTEDEIIKRWGERGLVKFWAKNHGVDTWFLQPKFEREVKNLLASFPPEEVAYYLFSRNFRQNLNKYGRDRFFESLNSSLETLRDQLHNLKKYFTPEEISKIHRKLFNEDLGIGQEDKIIRAAIPVYNDSKINKVAKYSSDWRDKLELETIKKFWNKGKNLFIISGLHHLEQQKDRLTQIVES